MTSLTEIRSSLSAMLGNPTMVKLVTTRVMLKTGVDLALCGESEDRSPESVRKVLGALSSMGYSTQALARSKK